MRHRLLLLLCVLTVVVLTFSANPLSAQNPTEQDSSSLSADPDIAVDPNNNKLYIPHHSGQLSIRNSRTLNAIDTIQNVGSGPIGVAVNLNNNKAYVVNYLSNDVAVIDGSTNKVTKTIPVGVGPSGIAVDLLKNIVYVSATGANNISTDRQTSGIYVIDSKTDTVIATIPSSVPSRLDVNPHTNMVYVTLQNSLGVINGSTNKVLTTNATNVCPIKLNRWGCFVSEVAVNANTNKVYVSSIPHGNPLLGAYLPPQNGTIYVIDGSSYKILGNMTLPNQGSTPFNSIAINSNTDMVYVSSPGSYLITVINGQSDTMVGTIKLNRDQQPWGIAVDPTSNTIYVVNISGGISVTTIDGNTNQVIPEFAVFTIVVFAIAIFFTVLARLLPLRLIMHK